MVYGYVRVSTDKQTVENQKFEIDRYAREHSYVIRRYISETISGTKAYAKRQLGRLLRHLKKGDIVIASELSRLGRSFYMIMEILNICLTKGCTVITIKDSFVLDNDIESKVLAFAFGLSAEIERNLISQRTKEALARARENGVRLGRPKGSKGKNRILDGKEDFIRRHLARGRSMAWISRRMKVHPNTLYAYAREHGIRKPKKTAASSKASRR